MKIKVVVHAAEEGGFWQKFWLLRVVLYRRIPLTILRTNFEQISRFKP
jgi:hypothetical protein